MNSAETYAGILQLSTQGVIGDGLISMHFGFWPIASLRAVQPLVWSPAESGSHRPRGEPTRLTQLGHLHWEEK
ncbi:hypothetical protein ACVWZZ_004361 [Bradyrhizobium sp. LM6.10]